RAEPGLFSESEIELLKTFADQAVIAIENVRLFKELEEKNQALTQAHAQVTEALEQQTATSEILKVISSSPTDLTPVLRTIAENARRVCGGYDAHVFLRDGEWLRMAAHQGGSESLPVPGDLRVSPGFVSGRAILERRVVQVRDLSESDEFPDGRELARRLGYRTNVAIPLLREGEAIGVLAIRRTAVAPFADSQIALLQTFADQAVIAIENVRLFTELQEKTAELTRSVDELTALGEVGRALSSTLNLEAVLLTIVTRATQLTETAGCVIWEYDKPREEFRLRVSHYADNADAAILPARGGVTTIPRGQGLTTQVMEERQAVQMPDITVEGAYESP
ncbi:MAG TPA: GAF domain-containing protein, partial [Vicinamibacterales bacterium]|nr:GAF domain-containing protein [Vicinamibacterales bacterium]